MSSVSMGWQGLEELWAHMGKGFVNSKLQDDQGHVIGWEEVPTMWKDLRFTPILARGYWSVHIVGGELGRKAYMAVWCNWGPAMSYIQRQSYLPFVRWVLGKSNHNWSMV